MPDNSTPDRAGARFEVLHVATYGLLRPDVEAADKPAIVKDLRKIGPCVIKGRLHDCGDYPGLVEGNGRVIGFLYALGNVSALASLDRYERYDPEDITGSLTVRKPVRLLNPALDAWVYLCDRPHLHLPEVAAGNWVRPGI